MKTEYPKFRIFVGLVVGLVVIVSIVGLFVAGSPGTERERKFDEQRISDLQHVSSLIDMHYERIGRLPHTLGEIATKDDSEYVVDPTTDPITDEPYEYTSTGVETYELCATFDQESTDLDERSIEYARMMPPMVQKDWNHPAGYHCFTLTVQMSEMRMSCGVERPCPTGETCAVLPNQIEALCIPEGKECISAGCPDECSILESYPVQVRCPVTDMVPIPSDDTSSCALMRDTSNGAVDCFGCAGTVCSTLGPGWEPWDVPMEDGYVGIPYSCYETPDGCALAQ